MKSEVVACLGYDAEVIASSTDDVHRLLAELEADPSKGKLQYETIDGVVAGSSTMTTGLIDATMATRASVPHLVDLLRDRNIIELVRTTPMFSDNGYGPLVALGVGGFFLCTCLKLLVDGLGCRHRVKAKMGKEFGFDGACLAPRWRKSEIPWTMEALAAKPVKLRSASRGGSEGHQATAMTSDVFTHSVSVISRIGDLCVLTFYICIYRYGSSLSVYSTLRHTLAAVSHTKRFPCCIDY